MIKIETTTQFTEEDNKFSGSGILDRYPEITHQTQMAAYIQEDTERQRLEFVNRR